MPRRKTLLLGRRELKFTLVGLDVRAEQWRKMSNYVESAHAILEDVRFRQMLECLRTECPANFRLPLDAKPKVRAAMNAFTEGYNTAISILLSLGTPWETQEGPEATFADENANPPK